MNDGLLFFKVYKTFPQHFKLRQKSPLKLPYAFLRYGCFFNWPERNIRIYQRSFTTPYLEDLLALKSSSFII